MTAVQFGRRTALPGSGAPTDAAESEVFSPATADTGLSWLRRVRSPLGIYTTPVLLVGLWQLLCSTGRIPMTIAASPVQVVQAAIHLWNVGAPSTLGEDLRVSLTRALVGLAVGASAGAVSATIAGLSRFG